MNEQPEPNPIVDRDSRPQRINWQAGEQQTFSAHTEWLQSLTIAESFQLYCSLMRLALSQRDDSEGWRRLEEMRFQEKLSLRQKMMRALKLDIPDAK
jgi:hypothetical protein